MPVPSQITTNFPGPYNVFIPAFDGKATANLIVSYARKPDKFAVTKLTQRTPVNFLSGYWLTLRPEVLARIMADPNETIWQDGSPAPTGSYNQQDFRATQYTCLRRARPAYIGWQTREQAAFPVQDTQLQVLGHQMITQRAYAFYQLAMNSANYLLGPSNAASTIGSHVGTATFWSSVYAGVAGGGGGSSGGGFFYAGTSTNPIIMRAIMNVANQITMDSMAAVAYTDLTMALTPPAAIGMATSAEIHDYLARNPLALAQVRGDSKSQNGQWGLPDMLYGMRVVIDPTLQTTSGRLVVPGTTQYIEGSNSALIMATPGDLPDNVGQISSSFSSFHFFFYRGEEMVTKTLDEPINERTMLRVQETWSVNMVSPETCGLITNLFY